ncbi:MAG: Crp/Fnr family transcriptional regulator [Anaerolineales bacterium]|nr:Crp/Fnr family transcriptional regulator [Anaerolineales bacterium]
METLTQVTAKSIGDTLDRLDGQMAGVNKRFLRQDDFLFHQEEPTDHIYYIISGHIRLFMLASDGRERTLRILGSGDLAGDYAFYLNKPHNSYAQAFDGPVEVYTINRMALSTLLRSQPLLYQDLLRLLADMTLKLAETIEDQTFKDLRERVQIALLDIAGRHGVVTILGVEINLHLTHEMIASIVGASRPRVSICLRELQFEGFYRVINQHIVLSTWAVGLVLPP